MDSARSIIKSTTCFENEWRPQVRRECLISCSALVDLDGTFMVDSFGSGNLEVDQCRVCDL